MPSYTAVRKAITELCSNCNYNWQGFCENKETHQGRIDVSNTQVVCYFKKGANPAVVFSTLRNPRE